MITKKQLESLIKGCEEEKRDPQRAITDSAMVRLSNRIEYYRQLIRYLETNPNESYLEAELEKLTAQVKSVEANFSKWQANVAIPEGLDPKKHKAKFAAETGIGEIKKRIKTLRLLLDK